MRFVTLLILLTLAAVVYVANTAPRGEDHGSAPRAVAPTASRDGAPPAPDAESKEAERRRLLASVEAPFSEGLDRGTGRIDQSSGFTPAVTANAPRVDGDLPNPFLADAQGAVPDAVESVPNAVDSGNVAPGAAEAGAKPSLPVPSGADDSPAAVIDVASGVAPGVEPAVDDDMRIDVRRPAVPAAAGTTDPVGVAAAGATGVAPTADVPTPGRPSEVVSSTSDLTPATPGATERPAVLADALRGSVSDTTGARLRGIVVRAVDAASGDPLGEARTDDEGVFAFETRDVGTARVRLVIDPRSVPLGVAAPVAQDRARASDDPLAFGAPEIDLGAGAAPLVQVLLPLSSGIQGTVLDRSGKAVEGALVRAVSRHGKYTAVRPVTETDADGFFFLTLVPGPYELQVLLPGDRVTVDERTRRLDVEAEEGAALLIDAIDFSKTPDRAPAGSAGGSRVRAEDARPAAEGASAAGSAEQSSGIRVAYGPEAPAPLPAVRSGGPAKRAPERRGELKEAVATAVKIVVAQRILKPRRPTVAPAPTAATAPEAAPDAAEAVTPTSAPMPGAVLVGRVISTWGEIVDGLDVVCISEAGERCAAARTDGEGRYRLEGIPAGVATVLVAPDALIDVPTDTGAVVRKRPAPVKTRSLLGSGEAIIDDVVVDVAPVFRIAGRLDVPDSALEAFRDALVASDPKLADLGLDSFRRIYLRGLKLTKRNAGGAGRVTVVPIAGDGTFEWQCSLPAQDVIFILEARTSVPGPGYGGPVGVEVTPAGVRTAPLTIHYPVPSKGPLTAGEDSADGLFFVRDLAAR